MRLEELQGHYESAEARGPGTRYALDLEGKRFSLLASAWSLTPRRSVPDGHAVELIGKRRLEGESRIDDQGLVLHAKHLTDMPGDVRGLGTGGLPPIRRSIDELLSVEVVREAGVLKDSPSPSGSGVSLHFKLYGSDVLVSRR